MAVEELGLRVAVEGFSKFTSEMKTMDKAIAGTAKSWTGMGKSAGGMVGSLDKVAHRLKNIGTSAQATLQKMQPIGLALTAIAVGGAAMMKSFVSEASSFNQQATLMELAARSSGTAFETLHDAALKVGADTRLVGVSASGAADSITTLYKAGLKTTDIFGDLNAYMSEGAELSGALGASVNLAAASELNMASAADVVSIAMATFGLNANQAATIANNFVQTADASVSSVSSLAAAMRNVGPTAAAFGWSLEHVNVALALLSTRGIDGAEAGTALKSMMTNLMRPTDKVTEALNELNVSLYDQSGTMRTMPDIIGQLQGALGGLTQEQRNQYVQTLAGTYGMKAMNTLLDEGVVGWRDMEKAVLEASTAQEIAARRAETFAGKMEALGGTIETVKIGLGERYLPVLGKVADGTAKLFESFNRLAPAAKDATAGALALTTGIAGIAGAVILLAPRIISTAQSLGTLVQFASDTTIAMQLLGEGASVANLGMAGMTASAAAVLIPLAALAVVAGAGYLAITNLDYTTEEAAESMGDFAEASAILNPELAELGDVTGEATERQYLMEAAMSDTAEVTQEVADAVESGRQQIDGWSSSVRITSDLTDGWVGSLSDTAMAADEAAGAVSDLSERAKDLASTFGELEFDNEAIWEMARASGASLEALSDLAVQLDIASNAEIQASFDVAMLNQQLGDGTITADEYVVGMNAVGAELVSIEASTIAAATSTTAMYDEVLGVTGVLSEETIANRELLASLGETTAASDDVATATHGMYEEILGATVAVGESTEAEIIYTEATDDMYESVLGLTAATEEETAAVHLEKAAMEDAATSTQNMYGELINATGATDDASSSANNLTGDMNSAADALNNAAKEAKAAADALNSIPKTIDVHVVTHYRKVSATETSGGASEFQHGTSFFQGGRALVGEAGPEIVVLPRGSRIIPNNQITNSYNYNLTTNATTRPGGLRMEFDTMAMATR